jgi:hypothetical protein
VAVTTEAARLIGHAAGTTLLSVVPGKSSRIVQLCRRSGPMFQACRRVTDVV